MLFIDNRINKSHKDTLNNQNKRLAHYSIYCRLDIAQVSSYKIRCAAWSFSVKQARLIITVYERSCLLRPQYTCRHLPILNVLHPNPKIKLSTAKAFDERYVFDGHQCHMLAKAPVPQSLRQQHNLLATDFECDLFNHCNCFFHCWYSVFCGELISGWQYSPMYLDLKLLIIQNGLTHSYRINMYEIIH